MSELSPSSPLLTADSVSLSTQGRVLLDDVSLTLQPGELLTLIGPNGAGKTTLIKILLGLTQADTGTIMRHDGLVIGYVPQRFQADAYLPLSVRAFLNLLTRRDDAAARDALTEVEAAHLADQPLSSLSGGELQRVLLARAVLRTPDLLVLDEPLQGLDINGELRFYDHLAVIRARLGCAILMVSHELHLVMASTDRVLCLNRHICCAGKPDDVQSDPAFIELFGPRAAAILATYSHQHDHAHGWKHEHRDGECKHG